MIGTVRTAAIGLFTGAVLGWFYGCFTQIWNHHVVGQVGFDPHHLMTIWLPGHVPSNLVLPKVAQFMAINLVGLLSVHFWVLTKGVRTEFNINELLAEAFGLECLFVGGLAMWIDLLYPFGGVAMLVAAFVGIFVYPAAIDHTRFEEQVFAHSRALPAADEVPGD